MATQTLINPFSMRCGTAVPAELYVSRPVEEATITERVLGSYFNNLSIVGLPKTGKSTIVSHCIIEKAEQLAKDKTIVDEIRKMGYEACLWGTKEARKVPLWIFIKKLQKSLTGVFL